MENEEEIIPTEDVDLDEDFEKGLDADLAKLSGKAEHVDESEPSTETAETTTDDKKSDASADETTSQSPAAEQPQDDPNKAIAEGFRDPVKGPGESEESFQLRKHLANLVVRRKAATTEEERQKLADEISGARDSLRTTNIRDNINRSQSSNDDNASPHVQPQGAQEGDSSLKRPATVEDLHNILQEERYAIGVSTTLESFIGRHPELQDVDTQQVFFEFVDANYNWQNKGGKDLMTVLELARDSMFKPSQTISERVLKSANVQQKVNAMQFPGGTVVKPSYTPEQQESIDDLVKLGYSEKDALDMITP